MRVAVDDFLAVMPRKEAAGPAGRGRFVASRSVLAKKLARLLHARMVVRSQCRHFVQIGILRRVLINEAARGLPVRVQHQRTPEEIAGKVVNRLTRRVSPRLPLRPTAATFLELMVPFHAAQRRQAKKHIQLGGELLRSGNFMHVIFMHQKLPLDLDTRIQPTLGLDDVPHSRKRILHPSANAVGFVTLLREPIDCADDIVEPAGD